MRWKWAAACVMAMLPPFRLLDAQTLALQEARSLLDSGKLSDAEAAVRKYLESDQRSPEAHELLGYILFKEDNPKPSLAEYAEAARYRAPDAVALEVIGCDYFLMEDYANADKWLTQSLAQNRKNALALYFLGRTKYNEKHFDEAIRLFSESLANGGKNVKTEENLGLSYERLGKTEEALAAYREAVSLDASAVTHDEGPYLDLGALLVENNRASEAIQYLKDAVQYGPPDARAHQELGKAYLLTNQIAAALAELTKAAQLDPENAPTHFLLAQVYRKQGSVEQARLESEQYAKLTSAHSSPDDPLSAARSLIQSGRLADAEREIRHYLEIHKNSADAHFLLGYILFKQQKAKESLAEYTEGAKYRTPSARDLEVVGGDYVLLQDFSDADKWFTKSVEWDPGNFQTLYYLGRTKYNENRFDEAVAVFKKCLELDPRSVKAEDNLGLSYAALGRTEDALAAYKQAISWDNNLPKDSGPYIDLGSLLVDNNRSSEAVPYLLEALRCAPQDLRAHRELGKAYLHLNELAKAQSELEKSVEIAPQNAPIHFMLAQVYRRRGMAEKARMESERYAALAGTHSASDTPQ